VVWTIPSPWRDSAVGAARLVSTPSRRSFDRRAWLGIACDRFPRIWAVLHPRFPGGHSSCFKSLASTSFATPAFEIKGLSHHPTKGNEVGQAFRCSSHALSQPGRPGKASIRTSPPALRAQICCQATLVSGMTALFAREVFEVSASRAASRGCLKVDGLLRPDDRF
jgi:hypothetical protein